MPARGRPAASDLDDMNVPGNDEFPGEDVVVSLDDAGIAALRPRSFDRLDAGQLELAGEAMQLVGHRRRLAQELDALVPEMRAASLSWPQIGWCVGISAQAAQKRWGQVVE